VHPERYALVERIAKDLGVPVASLVGDAKLIERIDTKRYIDGDVGLFTMNDILAELRKPGRDPRSAFEAPAFRDDVTAPAAAERQVDEEGVVTNIVAFGAFVDVGVHQDGLVHVSQLADRYVSDANQVVAVGQRVKVRVLGVDLQRNRIALTMKAQGSKLQAGSPKVEAEGAELKAGSAKPKAEGAKPFVVPKAGTVAPNGMRFK